MDVIINATRDAVPEGSTPLCNQGHYYHNVLNVLGYATHEPPVADLLRSYHGLTGTWQVLSPMHWEATHNDAMIVAAGCDLQLSDAASRCAFARLLDFVTHENIRLYYHDAHHWLMQMDDAPPLYAKPVQAMRHQSMMEPLKALDATLFWQRFITETQMLFSEHAPNHASADHNPINGVWIWGQGQLHARVATPVLCDNDATYTLARCLSDNVHYYQAGQTVAKNSVLLFDALPDPMPLASQFKKNTMHWYWNNTAYLTKPQSWFKRIRR